MCGLLQNGELSHSHIVVREAMVKIPFVASTDTIWTPLRVLLIQMEGGIVVFDRDVVCVDDRDSKFRDVGCSGLMSSGIYETEGHESWKFQRL